MTTNKIGVGGIDSDVLNTPRFVQLNGKSYMQALTGASPIYESIVPKLPRAVIDILSGNSLLTVDLICPNPLMYKAQIEDINGNKATLRYFSGSYKWVGETCQAIKEQTLNLADPPGKKVRLSFNASEFGLFILHVTELGAGDTAVEDRGDVFFTFTRDAIGQRLIQRAIYPFQTVVTAPHVVVDMVMTNNELSFTSVGGHSEVVKKITAIRFAKTIV